MVQYYAVRKSSDDDELKHWKYIKRIKVGKKWKYIYDDSELKKHQRGDVETKTETKGLFGNRTHTTITSHKTWGKLYDDERSIKAGNTTYTTIFLGKTSQLQAKGEKWLFDNMKKLVSNFKKTTGVGLKDDIEEYEKQKYRAINVATRASWKSVSNNKKAETAAYDTKEKADRYKDQSLHYDNIRKNAEENAKRAQTKVDETRSVYDKSILGRMEKGADYIENLFKKKK